jgi:hypothetical protein
MENSSHIIFMCILENNLTVVGGRRKSKENRNFRFFVEEKKGRGTSIVVEIIKLLLESKFSSLMQVKVRGEHIIERVGGQISWGDSRKNLLIC